jgi:RNA polymerase-associated protein LEO1
MSDAAVDPTISDDEVNDLATPAENEEVEAPRDTVEENGLDDEDEDDLFGDGDDAEAEEPM